MVVREAPGVNLDKVIPIRFYGDGCEAMRLLGLKPRKTKTRNDSVVSHTYRLNISFGFGVLFEKVFNLCPKIFLSPQCMIEKS